jgi:hypothetical protein
VDTETITRTIQLILAPVVMVPPVQSSSAGSWRTTPRSTCAFRTLAHERLDLLRSANDEPNPLVIERLAEIDLQLPEILGRHGLVHHSLLATYVSILILVATMCVSALSAATNLDWLVTSILVLFVAGIAGERRLRCHRGQYVSPSGHLRSPGRLALEEQRFSASVTLSRGLAYPVVRFFRRAAERQSARLSLANPLPRSARASCSQ